ncbi:uncharacterized protein LOC132787232 [Drosophila nasuta]|uniref:uncharacterized protein LOC132787232 n=1 Tax=Drosophila nasuta TaxID=42062 RepID=UPI00295F44AB|nr:uncharacterized protein LOC132787232 [Drosophila nasuta]
MCRRCVVCGKYVACNSADPYHYPKNKREALIWQRSMGANEICVETIQKQCCVCIKHIPQFVELAQKQAALITAKCEAQAIAAKQTKSRQSLNVLLLPGATLMPNCANASTIEEKTNGTLEDQKSSNCFLDEDEIVVSEFNVSDRGTTFPDLDETEVTVLRTPVDNDEQLKQLPDDNEQCGDTCGACTASDCTDVLLLSRSHSGETPCHCNEESPESAGAEMSLCPQMHLDMEHKLQTIPACECERKVRHELGEIIKRQQNRINELEYELCRQSDWQFTMYKKLNELYDVFGRLESPAACPQTTQPGQWQASSALSQASSRTEMASSRSAHFQTQNKVASGENFAPSSGDNIKI